MTTVVSIEIPKGMKPDKLVAFLEEPLTRLRSDTRVVAKVNDHHNGTPADTLRRLAQEARAGAQAEDIDYYLSGSFGGAAFHQQFCILVYAVMASSRGILAREISHALATPALTVETLEELELARQSVAVDVMVSQQRKEAQNLLAQFIRLMNDRLRR